MKHSTSIISSSIVLALLAALSSHCAAQSIAADFDTRHKVLKAQLEVLKKPDTAVPKRLEALRIVIAIATGPNSKNGENLPLMALEATSNLKADKHISRQAIGAVEAILSDRQNAWEYITKDEAAKEVKLIVETATKATGHLNQSAAVSSLVRLAKALAPADIFKPLEKDLELQKTLIQGLADVASAPNLTDSLQGAALNALQENGHLSLQVSTLHGLTSKLPLDLRRPAVLLLVGKGNHLVEMISAIAPKEEEKKIEDEKLPQLLAIQSEADADQVKKQTAFTATPTVAALAALDLAKSKAKDAQNAVKAAKDNIAVLDNQIKGLNANKVNAIKQLQTITMNLSETLSANTLDRDALAQAVVSQAVVSFLAFKKRSDSFPSMTANIGGSSNGGSDAGGSQAATLSGPTMAVTERKIGVLSRLPGVTTQSNPSNGKRVMRSGIRVDPVAHKDPAERAKPATGAIVTRVNVVPFNELSNSSSN